MLKFEEDFKQFLNKRALNAWNEIASNHEKHRMLCQRASIIHYRIRDLLPKEHRYLINEYEEIQAMTESIIIDTVYGKGLEDGLSIGNLLKEEREPQAQIFCVLDLMQKTGPFSIKQAVGI
ncbi:hypothetical protein [Anaerosolibacter sp.]|uniref:hypothetical protein n=1 Tax=Anaerosolibacter sp. TaxID=1872527 RepID=UPI0026256D4D|nr:hypothetical protein [Anaerosolibacter sp.]